MHSKITNNGGLLAYSDASWHKPNEIGYDMFGYNVYLMGGLISFASKNLKVVLHYHQQKPNTQPLRILAKS